MDNLFVLIRNFLPYTALYFLLPPLSPPFKLNVIEQ